jgi:NDP-sugar pyrophosphorylase family protein
MTVGSVLFMQGSSGENNSPGGGPENGFPQKLASIASVSSEPVALLEILGEPILHRIVEVLRRAEVAPIYLVVDQKFRDHEVVRSLRRERVEVLSGPAENLPSLVERAVQRCSDHGIENVLLLEPSAYAEIDVHALASAHTSSSQPITLAYNESVALPIAMVSSSEPDLAGTLVRRKLAFSQPMARFQHTGYTNRLRTAQDLHRLAQDALQHRCRIRPNGDEVRAGVWVAKTAYVHSAAQVIAPAYVGPNTRLRSGAMLADCSTVERDCIIERGTTVKNSSILGGTYIGVCLDVSNTVVNQSKLVDIRRNVGLEISDTMVGASSLASKMLVPSLWASVTGRSASSFGTMRGKFLTLFPKRSAAPAASARIAYAPAESWGTLKSLSRTDSTSI